jgi:phosphocarrier protein
MTAFLEKSVTIVNARGLHARAAARLVKTVEQFRDAEVRLAKDDMDVAGTSIMGLLMLGAGIGSVVTVRAGGAGAEAALAAVVALIERRFDEDA